MITTLFNYKPKGLSKEEILAEIENLFSWEQLEVLDELDYRLSRGGRASLKYYTDQELKDELESRRVWEGE